MIKTLLQRRSLSVGHTPLSVIRTPHSYLTTQPTLAMTRFGLIVSLVASLASIQAFTPVQPLARTTSSQTTTRLNELPAEVDTARISFFIWFFGASGGAGIARSAFPRMYDAVRYVQNLKGSPSAGGEAIGLNPLCGYPEDLSVADVEKIVNNKLSIEQIVQKYPIEGNYLTEVG